ncbi:MAG TPA: DUF4070 domain-containing protein, partial [Granulicella sp.]
PILLRGLSTLLKGLYTPANYFGRAMRSLESWQPRPAQKPPELPLLYNLRVFVQSMWQQGVCSNYRLAYWRFLLTAIRRWALQPAKMWLAFMVLLSANHFLKYAREVAEDLEEQCQALEDSELYSQTLAVGVESRG